MASKEAVLSALEKAAPADLRLYYPDGKQEEFWKRAKASPDYEEALREIRGEGERLLGSPTPELTYHLFVIYVERGTRREYESVYFERRRRLNTFAILSLLEPEREEWLGALRDTIWALCDEYTWCLPAHAWGTSFEIRRTIDLFSAETGFTLSEIDLLLGDRLPPLLRERIAEEVEARLFRPYLEAGPHHWEAVQTNWSAVCAGSIGAAALIALRDPDRLAAIVSKALGSMDCFLDGYGDDGGCLEGLGYWNYGFGYYVYFADLLRKRTNGAIDLFASDKVRRIAAFQQKSYLDGDLVANFSDSRPRIKVQLGLSHYLGSVYEEVELPPAELRAPYAEDHCSRWAHAFRNLIWFDPAKGGSEWAAADDYLPDAQWLVSRHRSGAGRFGFAAKGGHNAEPHNHNDVGHFIVTADGETFLADLGSGEYTKDYFGDGRYAYDCNGAQGHSVPIVDGALQAEGAESAAVVLEAYAGPEEDRLRIEMGSAYRVPNLKSLVRGFVWRKPEQGAPALELTDEFRFDGQPGSVEERFVSLLPPVLGEEGSVLVPGRNGRTLRIRYDADALAASVEERSFRDHSARETKWYAIRLAATRANNEAIFRLRFEFE
ncbi:heparinase II/III-family protein [Cohnella xylanilytica]|nr:heparinase II/III-family protein [Cohnella xylanilytica]